MSEDIFYSDESSIAIDSIKKQKLKSYINAIEKSDDFQDALTAYIPDEYYYDKSTYIKECIESIANIYIYLTANNSIVVSKMKALADKCDFGTADFEDVTAEDFEDAAKNACMSAKADYKALTITEEARAWLNHIESEFNPWRFPTAADCHFVNGRVVKKHADWAIEGIVREDCLIVLSAPSKVGKTTIVSSIAETATTGHGTFFGHRLQRGGVFMLDFESRSSEDISDVIAAKFMAFGEEDAVDGDERLSDIHICVENEQESIFYLPDGEPRSWELFEFLAFIEKQISTPEVRWLIIDPLNNFLQKCQIYDAATERPHVADENNNIDIGLVLGAVRRMASKTHTNIIITHHQSSKLKPQPYEDLIFASRGASAISATWTCGIAVNPLDTSDVDLTIEVGKDYTRERIIRWLDANRYDSSRVDWDDINSKIAWNIQCATLLLDAIGDAVDLVDDDNERLEDELYAIEENALNLINPIIINNPNKFKAYKVELNSRDAATETHFGYSYYPMVFVDTQHALEDCPLLYSQQKASARGHKAARDGADEGAKTINKVDKTRAQSSANEAQKSDSSAYTSAELSIITAFRNVGADVIDVNDLMKAIDELPTGMKKPAKKTVTRIFKNREEDGWTIETSGAGRGAVTTVCIPSSVKIGD